MTRRHFLRASSAAGAAVLASPLLGAADSAPVLPSRPRPRRALKKALMWATLGSETAKKLSVRERFLLLRDAGFAGVEVASAMDQAEVLAARDASGLAIPSVVISTHWAKPLSDPNPTARQVGLDGLLQGLRDAKAYGAASVLLVPAVVKKDVSYADAWARSTAEIAKAVPLAESLGVAIAIENVWNQFLLSPREAVEFVDSFRSPFVRWHFDVGNIINTGFPEQWIRTLGPRIVQVHAKEYSRKLRDTGGPYAGFKADFLTGDNDWPAVMAAFDAVGYSGWLIAEQYRAPGLGDAEWLAGLSAKLDEIIAC